MRKINESLQSKEIINVEKIRAIRNWVNEHYGHLTKQQKAKIFAKKIHQMIDCELPNFSQDVKTTVRKDLIQNHLTKQSFAINAKHIVDISVKHATDDERLQEICNWLHKVHQLDERFIEEYITQLYYENHHEQAATIAIKSWQKNEGKGKLKFEKKLPFVFSTIAALCFIFTIFLIKGDIFSLKNVSHEEVEIKSETVARAHNELPAYLQYQPINEEQLRSFLKSRNSLLVEEPYFSTIIEVAERFNIHPFFMFAITGQEQGFVPKTDKDAHLIANNPYNVFYNWQDYNTDILDSSEIAARTIVNLSEDRPEDVNPIQWINRKYAQDQNWWIGVTSIFHEIQDYVE